MNVEDRTFQHSIILSENNNVISLSIPDLYLVYAWYMPYKLVSVIFDFGTLEGGAWKLEELDIHAHSMA